jgi:hypothetical protein
MGVKVSIMAVVLSAGGLDQHTTYQRGITTKKNPFAQYSLRSDFDCTPLLLYYLPSSTNWFGPNMKYCKESIVFSEFERL